MQTPTDGLRWDDVPVLLALAREGSLKRAAAHLRVNISTVSRRLDALEEAVGLHLFDRTPEGTRPTAAAERLLPFAESMEQAAFGMGRILEGFEAEPGATYETADCTVGEVRTVSEGERLRMTWQPAGRDEPTTLQLTLSCPRNDDSKTTLRVHHEKLADADEREAMGAHWRDVLDRIEASLADDG